MKKQKDCQFCQIVHGDADADLVGETDNFIAFYDEYPVTDGHTLVIPKSHVQHLEEYENNIELLEFVLNVHDDIKKKHDVKDTNIGINNGSKAGQTIPHVHWHIIPRYSGDMNDPTGGVRGVIPDERKY